MTDRTAIKAFLYLHAVFPQIAEVVRVDPVARELVAGWRASIQLQVLGGPATVLRFADGDASAARRASALPSLGLLLPGAGAAVKMFEGGGATPLPWMGVWRLRLIRGLRVLSDRLGHHVRVGTEQIQSAAELRAVVAVRLAVLANAVQVLSEHWDEGRRLAADAPDGVASIRVAGGTALQVVSAGGRFSVSRGQPQRPNLIVEFADDATALGFLTQSVDVWTALGTGAVRIRGLLPLMDVLQYLMGKVGGFLNASNGSPHRAVDV